MDEALILARAQFGLNIGFHILFPTITIGLAWIVAWFPRALRDDARRKRGCARTSCGSGCSRSPSRWAW